MHRYSRSGEIGRRFDGIAWDVLDPTASPSSLFPPLTLHPGHSLPRGTVDSATFPHSEFAIGSSWVLRTQKVLKTAVVTYKPTEV